MAPFHDVGARGQLFSAASTHLLFTDTIHIRYRAGCNCLHLPTSAIEVGLQLAWYLVAIVLMVPVSSMPAASIATLNLMLVLAAVNTQGIWLIARRRSG